MLGVERRDPYDYFAQNGFYVFRGVCPPTLLEQLKSDIFEPALASRAGSEKYVCTDATLKWRSLQRYVIDPRFTLPVEQCIGPGAKFLQVADVHINHNVYGWHRDSASRFFGGIDWQEDRDRYTCAKAIVYVECEDFGLEVVPCSHRIDIPQKQLAAGSVEPQRLSAVTTDLPSFDFTPTDWHPVVVGVQPGDMLVFDQRLFHRGHPQNTAVRDAKESNGATPAKYAANKTTFCFCYGQDNFHSRRYHSYFRYHRTDLKYAEAPAQFTEELRRAGRLLSTWDENYLVKDPLARSDLYVSAGLRVQKQRSADRVKTDTGLDAPVGAAVASPKSGKSTSDRRDEVHRIRRVRAGMAADASGQDAQIPEPIVCPICSRADELCVARYPGKLNWFFANTAVVGCPSCGFGWVPMQPLGLPAYKQTQAAQQTAKLLPPHSFWKDASSLNLAGLARTKRHLGVLASNLQSSQLDCVVGVGCGFGLTLTKIDAQHKVGVEDASKHPYLAYQGIKAVSDVGDLSDNSADLIIVSHYLSQFQAGQLHRIVQKLSRTLRIGGRLLVEEPNRALLELDLSDLNNAPKLSFFSLRALKLLLKTGFDVEFVRADGRSQYPGLRRDGQPLATGGDRGGQTVLVSLCRERATAQLVRTS